MMKNALDTEEKIQKAQKKRLRELMKTLKSLRKIKFKTKKSTDNYYRRYLYY